MRVKKDMDERTLKKKIKTEEKGAIKELRKDTHTIQEQRSREKMQRRGVSRKGTYKLGASLKDEV